MTAFSYRKSQSLKYTFYLVDAIDYGIISCASKPLTNAHVEIISELKKTGRCCKGDAGSIQR